MLQTTTRYEVQRPSPPSTPNTYSSSASSSRSTFMEERGQGPERPAFSRSSSQPQNMDDLFSEGLPSLSKEVFGSQKSSSTASHTSHLPTPNSPTSFNAGTAPGFSLQSPLSSLSQRAGSGSSSSFSSFSSFPPSSHTPFPSTSNFTPLTPSKPQRRSPDYVSQLSPATPSQGAPYVTPGPITPYSTIPPQSSHPGTSTSPFSTHRRQDSLSSLGHPSFQSASHNRGDTIHSLSSTPTRFTSPGQGVIPTSLEPAHVISPPRVSHSSQDHLFTFTSPGRPTPTTSPFHNTIPSTPVSKPRERGYYESAPMSLPPLRSPAALSLFPPIDLFQTLNRYHGSDVLEDSPVQRSSSKTTRQWEDRSSSPTPTKRSRLSRSPSVSEEIRRTPGIEDHVARFEQPKPIPPPGSELARVRAAIAAQEAKTESRRPEYLRRTMRPIENLNDEDDSDTHAAVGIVDSPSKGRRLKLFRHPELDALSDGPRTPPPSGRFGKPMSRDAIAWMESSSPDVPKVRQLTPEELDEQQQRKQRRLAAFAHSSTKVFRQPLRAVDRPGLGRVLEPYPAAPTTATSDESPRSVTNDLDELPEPSKPLWLDQELPWKGRQEEDAEAEERKLKMVARYFADDTDEEEDEAEEPTNPEKSLEDDVLDVEVPSSGRGGGKGEPSRRTMGTKSIRQVFFPSDPADARSWLRSKRKARAYRQTSKTKPKKVKQEDEDQQSDQDEEDGVIACVCGSDDDGRPMVRCDRCHGWFHLVCMNIRDENELGAEWFCWRCSPMSHSIVAAAAPNSTPTFAPSQAEPKRPRSNLPLYQPPTLQPSPMIGQPPVTPGRSGFRGEPSSHSAFRNSGSWDRNDLLGDPSTPRPRIRQVSREGRNIFSTPGHSEEFTSDEYRPFDPMSTPSRGLKFDLPFASPTRDRSWSSHNRMPFETPNNRQYESSSSSRGLPPSSSLTKDSRGLSSPLASYSTYQYALDDSPVRQRRNDDLTAVRAKGKEREDG